MNYTEQLMTQSLAPQSMPFEAPLPIPPAGGQPMMPPAPAPDPMGAMIPPQQHAFNVGPPKTPEEVAQRQSGWAHISQQFASNPLWQMAAIKMGAALMQPIQPGQTAAGHLGAAVGGAADYMTETAMVQQKAAAEQQRIALESQRVQNDTTQTAANVKNINSQTTSRDTKLPVEIKQIESQTGHTTAQTGLIVEQTATEKAKIAKMDAEITKMVKDGELTEAQAGYYRAKAQAVPDEARADLIRAHAATVSASKNTQLETLDKMAKETAKQLVIDSGGTMTLKDAETKAWSDLAASKSTGKTPAAVQSVEQYMKGWSAANPKGEKESDAEYKARQGKAQTSFMSDKKKMSEDDARQKFVLDALTLDPDADPKKLIKKFNDMQGAAGAPKLPTAGDATKGRLKFDAQGNPIK